ncbi:MAG: YlxR family protein [Chloroflexi bacterium]|nr:YlxR family protein [Chloroflexota bacterium]
MHQKSKYIPQRTCIACQQKTDKKDLIRLVRTDKGSIEVDMSARKPGRGAYLCPKRRCWEMALGRKRLERALRTNIDDANRETLLAYDKIFPEGDLT